MKQPWPDIIFIISQRYLRLLPGIIGRPSMSNSIGVLAIFFPIKRMTSVFLIANVYIYVY